jgi:hypothetical protein
MGGFYSEEYHDLVAAQRAITLAMKPKPTEDGKGEVYPDARDVSQLATALTRVIDQKRVMRGQPAPKPVDTSVGRAARATRPRALNSHAQPLPDPPAAPAPGAQTP